jgi:hypothetical protein
VHSPPLSEPVLRAEPVQPLQAYVKHTPKKRSARPRPEPAVTAVPEFVAIPYAEPLWPSEQIDIYRVELPRATLAHFGLPMRAGTLDSTVTADVAVGTDGVARAIRFVQ